MLDQIQRLASLKTRMAKILEYEHSLIGFGHRDSGTALFNLFQEEEVYIYKRTRLSLMAALLRHPEISKEVGSFGDFDVSKYMEGLTLFFDELDSSKSFDFYMRLVRIGVEGLSDIQITHLEEECEEIEKTQE